MPETQRPKRQRRACMRAAVRCQFCRSDALNSWELTPTVRGPSVHIELLFPSKSSQPLPLRPTLSHLIHHDFAIDQNGDRIPSHAIAWRETNSHKSHRSRDCVFSCALGDIQDSEISFIHFPGLFSTLSTVENHDRVRYTRVGACSYRHDPRSQSGRCGTCLFAACKTYIPESWKAGYRPNHLETKKTIARFSFGRYRKARSAAMAPCRITVRNRSKSSEEPAATSRSTSAPLSKHYQHQQRLRQDDFAARQSLRQRLDLGM
jgi:hypothetical protein